MAFLNGHFLYIVSKPTISCPEGFSALLLASCSLCSSQNFFRGARCDASPPRIYNNSAKIRAKAVICILWDPKLTRSGNLAYLYIIHSLLTLLLMIIRGFINPFNRGQSLLAVFCCPATFKYVLVQ